MDPARLSRLSALLDVGLELADPEREGWLAALDAEDAPLAGTLRGLLARRARLETDDLLSRGPAFGAHGSEAADGEVVGPYRCPSPRRSCVGAWTCRSCGRGATPTL